MWAGNDDIWDNSFVEVLVDAHERYPDAVACFCPMIFIDEDDQAIPEYGVRAVSYEAASPGDRIRKLITAFDDAFGYGMFKREAISGVEFPVWWWINSTCAYNNIYPTLCYYLARGNFKLVGHQPLWFNRLKRSENVNHKLPYNNFFLRGWFAFALRKFNLVQFSLKQIQRAGSDLPLTLRVAPLMAYRWFLYPSYREFRHRLAMLIKGKLKFF